MQFKLGDFVRFVDERREGYITRVIDHQMVGVTGDDDFEIPVLSTKITLVYGQKSSEKEEEPVEKLPVTTEFKKTGVYFGIATDPHAPSVVHFYMINETSYQLLASITSQKNNTFKGVYAGIISPNFALKVHSANLTELDSWPDFTFQVIFYSTQNAPQTAPLNITKMFRAKDFSGPKKEISLIKQQGWQIQLDENELVIDTQKLKESFFKSAEEKKAIENPGKEIDLHIEKLRDDHQFLKPAEMLAIQLNHFNKCLDAAIVHKLPAIIFIHGAGNGTLRHEIHKAISKHPQVKTFMDARKEKFGYGATEVILK